MREGWEKSRSSRQTLLWGGEIYLPFLQETEGGLAKTQILLGAWTESVKAIHSYSSPIMTGVLATALLVFGRESMVVLLASREAIFNLSHLMAH